MNLRAHAMGAGFVEVRYFRRPGCPAQRQARCLPLRHRLTAILRSRLERILFGSIHIGHFAQSRYFRK